MSFSHLFPITVAAQSGPMFSCISTSGDTLTVARRLSVAQAFAVFCTSVDLTLTGLAGASLAPVRSLATLPFSLISIVALLSTFGLSALISRWGYRRVFTISAGVGVVSGLLSAGALTTRSFGLFCLGVALIGVLQACVAYFPFAAADAAPHARAGAVTTVLAGGLLAAVVGPFLATGLEHLTAAPYAGAYLLVTVSATGLAGWVGRTRRLDALRTAPRSDDGPVRPRRDLWLQPQLLLGAGTATVAAWAMMTFMTAGPIAGQDVGHTSGATALAVQLHMVGMYAPGLLVARVIDRVGVRLVAVGGFILIASAGGAAVMGAESTPAFLAAMALIGVGWNLAFSAGNAMVAGAYTPGERGRVQPFAQVIVSAGLVTGAFTAGRLADGPGWTLAGWAVITVAAVAMLALALSAVRASSVR